MEDIYKLPEFPENPEGPGIKVGTKFGTGRTYQSIPAHKGKQVVYLDDGTKVLQTWHQMRLLEIIPKRLINEIQE